MEQPWTLMATYTLGEEAKLHSLTKDNVVMATLNSSLKQNELRLWPTSVSRKSPVVVSTQWS